MRALACVASLASLTVLCWPAHGLGSSTDLHHPKVVHLGSEIGCPEADALAQVVRQIRGTAAGLEAYTVVFVHEGNSWRADLHPTATPSQRRTLEDSSSDCAALGRAVALTLALFLDEAGAAEQQEAPLKSAVPEQSSAAEPKPPLQQLEEDGPRGQAWLGGGAGMLFGVIAPASPAFTGELSLEWELPLVLTRLSWAPPQRFELGSGSVSVSAYLATVLGCANSKVARASGAVCAGFDTGLLSGRGNGYDEEDIAWRPYLAGALELRLGLTLGAGLRAVLSGGVTVPFARESFSIEGVGSAYIPPGAGARCLLGVTGQLGP